MIAISTKVKKKKKKSKSKSGHAALVEDVGSSSPPPVSSKGEQEAGREDPGRGNHGEQEAGREDPGRGNHGDKLVPLRESASSSSSRLSLDSMTDDGSAPMYVALTTANQLISGEAMAAASATALVLSASSSQLPASSTSPPASPSPVLPAVLPAAADQELSAVGRMDGQQSPNRCSSPSDEMRSAMLALSKMKDELESDKR